MVQVRGFVLVSVLAAVVIAGCGGGSPTTVTTSTQPSTPNAETVTNAPIATEPDSPASGVELIASTLQLDLQKLGYDSGPIGTDFSSATTAALKRFQSSAEVARPEHRALGTPVIVYDTTGRSPSVKNAPADAAPGY